MTSINRDEEEYEENDADVEESLLQEEELNANLKKPERWNKYQAIYVFCFCTLYFLGSAFSFPLMTLRLVELYEKEGYSPQEASAQATVLSGWLSGLQYFGNFFTGPVYGALSDRYGRKPFFAISITSYSLYIASLVAGRPIWLLFAARATVSLCDSMWTMVMISITDVTPSTHRAFGFGLLWVSLGISMLGFPLVSGYLADIYGITFSFKVGLCISVLALIVLVGMPETKRVLSTKRITKETFNPFLQFWLLFQNKTTTMLAFVSIIISLAIEGIMDIFSTWVKYSFPNLSYLQIGSLSGALGCGLILSGPINRFVVPKLGEEVSICLATLIGGLCVAAYPTASPWWMLYPLLLVRSVNSVAAPTIQSIIFKQTDLDNQSALVGVLVSAKNIPSIIGPFIFPQIYAYYIQDGHPYIPGMTFYIVAALNVLCCIICTIFFWFTKWSPNAKKRPNKSVTQIQIQ
eukprot:TRINITY_DN8793_c0_g1_i1.p1 TRINITY_DN8793_c0_g1~~TRINITY_DN8793_c0_g1_i1.p1  ORF type:complete len:463 (-),score=65.39 TRINITY_DN8793_c0_g1_i1:3-1391(-)